MIIADIWNYIFYYNIIHVVFLLYWLLTYVARKNILTSSS